MFCFGELLADGSGFAGYIPVVTRFAVVSGSCHDKTIIGWVKNPNVLIRKSFHIFDNN